MFVSAQLMRYRLVRSLFVWAGGPLDYWPRISLNLFRGIDQTRYSLAGLVELSISVQLEHHLG
jgi:hypothetical protein